MRLIECLSGPKRSLVTRDTPALSMSAKPGAGKPHAGFDEAGAGNGLSSTAPVLDPTKNDRAMQF
jgi:hypothetical protein